MLHYIFHNHRINQSVGCEEFFRSVAVSELLFSTVAKGLYSRRPKVAGYLLAKTAVERTVFKSDDKPVVGGEAVEQIAVNARDVTRVDECGTDAMRLQQTADTLAEREEIAEGENGYIFSPLHYLVCVQSRIVGRHRARGRQGDTYRDTDSHGVFPVTKAPVEHGQVFLAIGGGEIDEVGNVG